MKLARDEIIWRVVDGEALLLDGDTGYYFSLDESGTIVWNLLNECDDLESVVSQLAKNRNCDKTEAQQMVADLLTTLKIEGILPQGTYESLCTVSSPAAAVAENRPQGSTYKKPVLKKYDQIDHVAIYGLND